MSSIPSRILRPLVIAALSTAFAGMALVASLRLSHPPATAAPLPASAITAAPAQAQQGFVSRSAHFTLTAEIHAGS